MLALLDSKRRNELNEQRSQSLHELSLNLGVATGFPPIAATAVCEHVFQELIQQFYEKGCAYLPNFGWLIYADGAAVFTPCEAMEETLSKIETAMASSTFSFAGIEARFRCESSKSV